MSLMIPEAAWRRAQTAEVANTAADVLFHATGECALGWVLVARSDKGVCAILIGASQHEPEAELAVRFPRSTLIGSATVVGVDVAKVIRFVDAPADGLHLTLDMRGTPFQRRVWERLRGIPVGRTLTYTELARRISALASPRAVGAACAANPIALAIPCHRVVRRNGDLAGYRWGIERKRDLLRREAAAAAMPLNCKTP